MHVHKQTFCRKLLIVLGDSQKLNTPINSQAQEMKKSNKGFPLARRRVEENQIQVASTSHSLTEVCQSLPPPSPAANRHNLHLAQGKMRRELSGFTEHWKKLLFVTLLTGVRCVGEKGSLQQLNERIHPEGDAQRKHIMSLI